MSNLLQDGVTWLSAKLKTAAGVTVKYYRGSSYVEITATPSLHEYEVVDEDGFATALTSRDYIITADDLVIATATTAPRPGDRIIESINGESRTFEVMPLAAGQAYEPLDKDGELITVHTKRVD